MERSKLEVSLLKAQAERDAALASAARWRECHDALLKAADERFARDAEKLADALASAAEAKQANGFLSDSILVYEREVEKLKASAARWRKVAGEMCKASINVLGEWDTFQGDRSKYSRPGCINQLGDAVAAFEAAEREEEK